MALSEAEELELLELERARHFAMAKAPTAPIEQAQPEAPTFMQGLKAGALDQPAPQAEHWYSPAAVGHFVGEAALPTAGAIVGSVVPGYGTAVGAAAGEAAKKAIGRGYEAASGKEFKDESAARTITDVAAAGALQKAGEVAGPAISKGISKAGEAIGGVTDWLSSKIGKSFIKANKGVMAYGHEPERAISQEGIIAHSWDSLVDKTKAAKHDVGQEIDDLLTKSEKDTLTNVDDVVKPIDDMLSKSADFPNENKTLVDRLTGLKQDVLNLLHKGDATGRPLNVERANNIKKSLYKVTKYSGANSDDIPLNKVKQQVARNIANKIEEVTPEIKVLNQRYGDLVALENAATNRAIVAQRADVIGLPEMFGVGIAGTGNLGLGAGVVIANRALKTPLGGTAAMAGLKAAGEAARTAAPAVGKAVESIASKSGAALTPLIERSPNDVKQDYKSGKITREQALKELRETHGFK